LVDRNAEIDILQHELREHQAPVTLSPRISCENNLSRTCRLGGRPFDWVSAIQPNNRSYKMQNAAMRGDKIYDVELDITGVTDYGVSMDAILAGQEAIYTEPDLTLRSMGGSGAASRDARTASTICGCAPMVASSSTCT
jgi:hypothetical protein